MLYVHSPLTAEEEAILRRAVDVGYTVHRELGPGFKEKIYEEAYCLELEARNIRFERQKRIDVRFKGKLIPGQKIDSLLEDTVLIELKAVPRLRRIHRAQLISYLKTTGLRAGLVINFNTEWFKTGVKRVIYTIGRRR
jgi:GxxExxY protein